MCRKNAFSFSYEFPFILSSNQNMACCVFFLFLDWGIWKVPCGLGAIVQPY